MGEKAASRPLASMRWTGASGAGCGI